jgi:hypothetical protein
MYKWLVETQASKNKIAYMLATAGVLNCRKKEVVEYPVRTPGKAG